MTAASDADAAAEFDELERGTPSESDMQLAALALDVPGLLPPGVGKEEVASLLCSFGRNNFGLLSEMHSLVGAGCYPAAALLNHSCRPNCVLAFNGSTLQVRTLVDVRAGDELCHSYVELCQPTSVRRAQLSERYGFHCECPRCAHGMTSEDGEDVDATLQRDGSGDSSSSAGLLERAASLLAHAACEDDEEKEKAATMGALSIRRQVCHPWSLLRYEAEGRALSICLALGELSSALECCRHAVGFLQRTLAHLPCHPMLALQQYTLADLEMAVGEPRRALELMEVCSAALDVTAADGCTVRTQARERLAELRELVAR